MQELQAKANVPNNEPEFQKLLAALRCEVDIANERAFIARYCAGLIKPFEEKVEKVAAEPTKEPVGVIDFFWAEVWKLRSANTALHETNEHLRSLVGS